MNMNGENFELVVAGINHKNSTISDREVLQISRGEIAGALDYFKSKSEISGIVIVTTCNRIEFYLVLRGDVEPLPAIEEYYAERRKIDAAGRTGLFYVYREKDAARHLFHVVSGLDSMLFGEYQVQGQIKEAYSIACSKKAADKILHKLFHSAFRVGKTVRSQTKIGSGKQSLSGVACKIITENSGKNEAVTIVGVNENTKILAEKLYRAGYSNLVFVNRTLYKAEELAHKYGGRAVILDNISEPLSGSKCLFSCTGSPDYVIPAALLKKIYARMKFPKLIIDMAVPRDVETNGLPEDVAVYDLEGLKLYLENEKMEIVSDLPVAEKIISDEINVFEAWSESQNDDLFGPVAEKMELARLQLLDESKALFSEDDFHLLEKFSRSLVHRMKSLVGRAVTQNCGDD